MKSFSWFKPALVVTSFCLGTLVCNLTHADLLTNGDFETMGTSNQTIHNGTGALGSSAAANWGIFHNTNGSTETNWLTYDQAGLLPFLGQNTETDHVLRAEVSHAGNGLVQTWAPLGSGPAGAEGSVWIHTNPGQIVGVGVGNGGGTFTSAFTSGAGGWEEIVFTESNSPVNEMIIYAETSGAEFYVDLARVSAVPEPTSAGALGIIGIAGLALRRRKRLG